MMRCRSRAWKRYTICPPGLFNTVACLPIVHSPCQGPLIEPQSRGGIIRAAQIHDGSDARDEAGGTLVAEGRFGRSQVVPISRGFDAAATPCRNIVANIRNAGLPQ